MAMACMNGGSGRLFKLAAGVLASALFVFGGAASAATAWHGSDYSYTYDSNTRLGACDGEDDGYQAYGYLHTWSGVYDYVYDTNGASSGCGYGGAYTTIKEHQTCEAVPYDFDPCSAWVRDS